MEDIGIDRLREAARDLRIPAPESVDDRTLLDLQRALAEVRRLVDAASVPLAAEKARRSDPALGHAGLAQRLGMRSPEALLQRVTGATGREARAIVKVGSVDVGSALGSAVRSGALSVAAASAISSGLGDATAALPDDVLEGARAALVAEAPARTVEQLATRARELRDELDADGVGDRTAEMRAKRFVRLVPQDDGMTRIYGLLDAESAARMKSVFDSVTSPRRGGPRFVAVDQKARAEAIVADDRTTEQLALDALVDLLEAGAAVPPDSVRAVHAAPVQVLVLGSDLASGRGGARLEGQSAFVPVSTAQRLICVAGSQPVILDTTTQRLDLGRERRFFTRAQRRVIAARDGGCIFPNCTAPPSWCEAHHIIEVSRGGRTDVADGVLLCRHHHLLVHDNGWRVERERGSYFLIPPDREDPLRRRIPVRTKNPLMRRLTG